MANTYFVSDALNIANRAFPRAIEGDSASYIANIALNAVWHAYDWRVTIANLPPFWLIPLVQDYGVPYYAVPVDFFGLREAYLVQMNSAPLPTRGELKIIKNVRKEYVRGLTNTLGYIPETRSFRTYPVVPDNIGASSFLIDGTYKTLAPTTTSTTLQSTLVPWDDIYINNFVMALRWAAAEVADAPTKNQKKQELMMALAEMAGQEGIELGDQPIAPSEGLVGGEGLGYFPGIGVAIF